MTHEIPTTLAVVKNLAYIPAILVGLSMESYAILAVLMLIDTVFGVVRVGVVHGGKHIKSYKLIAGALSKLTVISIPLVLVWAGKGAGIDFAPIAQATLGVLVLAETYSIVGSMYAIRVKRDVPEWDAVSWILRSVQRVIEGIIKRDVSKGSGHSETLDRKARDLPTNKRKY